MGMRATHSDDTILDGAFVPDRHIVRVIPAGGAGMDAFVLVIFAGGLLGFGNVYCGMVRRRGPRLRLGDQDRGRQVPRRRKRVACRGPGLRVGIETVAARLDEHSRAGRRIRHE